MSDRDELIALRRLAELEAKAAQPPAQSTNQAASQARQERTIGEEALRQVGLTARYGLEGVAGIPQLLGGAMEAAGIKGAGVNIGKQFSDFIGLPSPETSIERVTGAATSAMAGGSPLLKAGQVLSSVPNIARTAAGVNKSLSPSVRQSVGSVMASQPAAQLALGGVSGGASGMAQEGGLGAGAQFAAGLIAPLATAPLASGAIRAGKIAKNIVSPLTSESALERGAARLAVRALGGRAEQATTALGGAADDVTAGQVASAIDNADLAALQKIANQRDASLTDLIHRGTQQKLKQSWDNLEAKLSPVRDEALALAERGGVDPTQLFSRVSSIANARGQKTSDVVQNSMSEIFNKLRIAVNPETGLADPIELNNIRKQIRNYIEKHSQENKDWDQKRTAGLERQIQLAIDDAIEAGIAKADPSKSGIWSQQYMGAYRDGASMIRKVEKGLEREVELATKGMPEVRSVISDTENPTRGLNLLSRVASLTNFAIRAAEGSSGRAVEKKLAQMMAPSDLGGDKQRLAELMRAELNRPKGMFESMKYQAPQTRAQLGYGLQEPAPPQVSKSTLPVPFVSSGEYQSGAGGSPNWTFGTSRPVVDPDIQVGVPTQGMLGYSPFADASQNIALKRRMAGQAATERDAAIQAAETSAPRTATGRGTLFDFDPVTGKLNPVSEGMRGATPDVIQSTGNTLNSAANKVASGQRFAMSAEERIAWDKAKVDLADAAPQLRGLSDDAIASKIADRQWVNNRITQLKTEYADWAKSAADKFNAERAAKLNELANSKQFLTKAEREAKKAELAEAARRMKVMQQVRKDRMQASIDALEGMSDTLGHRAGSRIFVGQGPKTRAAQRGMMTGESQ